MQINCDNCGNRVSDDEYGMYRIPESETSEGRFVEEFNFCSEKCMKQFED